MKKYLSIVLAIVSCTSLSLANEPNTDRPGGDYRSIENINVQNCEEACDIENRCKSWTFVQSTSKCYLKNIVPTKAYSNIATSGLSKDYYKEVEKLVASKGRDVMFMGVNLNSRGRDSLRDIVNTIKQYPNIKLYISVKKKAAGWAKQKVKKLPSILSTYGLNPNQYHVQKVDKNDKKKKRWLSKNGHLWMRVTLMRD